MVSSHYDRLSSLSIAPGRGAPREPVAARRRRSPSPLVLAVEMCDRALHRQRARSLEAPQEADQFRAPSPGSPHARHRLGPRDHAYLLTAWFTPALTVEVSAAMDLVDGGLNAAIDAMPDVSPCNDELPAGSWAGVPAPSIFATSARKDSQLCMHVPPTTTRTPGLLAFISATWRASSYVIPPTMKMITSTGGLRLPTGPPPSPPTVG